MHLCPIKILTKEVKMKHIFTITKRFLLTSILVFAFIADGQVHSQMIYPSEVDKKLLEKVKNSDRSEFRYIPKRPGHYSAEEWRAVIDETWGEGLPTETKLNIFDGFWNTIDKSYPSFFHINVNWDSLRDVYRPEVESGVSRGRFFAIMCQLEFALHDVHTWVCDLPVAMDTLKPGVPLLVVDGYKSIDDKINGYSEYSHFGAGLSPLPDSSLLVYDVVANHPLGLERGDIVVGYDGIPWKVIYKELLKAELPFAAYAGTGVGTSDFSVTHHLLTAAGENWHLFDTIDIVKYNSGETLHLPTALLQDQQMEFLASAQLPIPGVPFPDFENGHGISWGLINGTQIGYIYAWNWRYTDQAPGSKSAGDDFREAIISLMNDYNTTGLIIDSRRCAGGQNGEWAWSLEVIFNQDQDRFRDDRRNNPNDHFSMEVFQEIEFYNTDEIIADKELYDRPIAVLTGPASGSAGDYMPLMMRYHPMAKIFGLPTNAAFGWSISTQEISIILPVFPNYYIDISQYSEDWHFQLTIANACLWENPGEYLTHLNIPVDDEVWLTQEDVAKEEDTVVKRAMEWINNLAYAHDVSINKICTESSTDTVLVSAIVENPNHDELSVKAILFNHENTFADSFYFHNDGINGDISSDDSIWVANCTTRNMEDIYDVWVKTEDLTANTIRTLPKVATFTTLGPITFSDYVRSSLDTITFPSQVLRLACRFGLENMGSTGTAKDVTAKLICIDSCASFFQFQEDVYVSNLSYGDIEPEETVLSQGDKYIYFFESKCTDSAQYALEIYSNSIYFWSDTFTVYVDTISTSSKELEINIPKVFALSQNYPNPFNPKTVISWQLPVGSEVDLSIFNILGQKVATLVSRKQKAGFYEVEWDAGGFASGVYYYRLQAGEYVATKKLVLLK